MTTTINKTIFGPDGVNAMGSAEVQLFQTYGLVPDDYMLSLTCEEKLWISQAVTSLNDKNNDAFTRY